MSSRRSWFPVMCVTCLRLGSSLEVWLSCNRRGDNELRRDMDPWRLAPGPGPRTWPPDRRRRPGPGRARITALACAVLSRYRDGHLLDITDKFNTSVPITFKFLADPGPGSGDSSSPGPDGGRCTRSQQAEPGWATGWQPLVAQAGWSWIMCHDVYPSHDAIPSQTRFIWNSSLTIQIVDSVF